MLDMDDEFDQLSQQALIAHAQEIRLRPPDQMPAEGNGRPLALEIGRRNRMREVLRECRDPFSNETDEKKAPKLSVSLVWAVAEPDARGLSEVNYVAPGDVAMTAWMRGRELAYLEEGW